MEGKAPILLLKGHSKAMLNHIQSTLAKQRSAMTGWSFRDTQTESRMQSRVNSCSAIKDTGNGKEKIDNNKNSSRERGGSKTSLIHFHFLAASRVLRRFQDPEQDYYLLDCCISISIYSCLLRPLPATYIASNYHFCLIFSASQSDVHHATQTEWQLH